MSPIVVILEGNTSPTVVANSPTTTTGSVIQTYANSNANNFVSIGNNVFIGAGQSFTGNGSTLGAIAFFTFPSHLTQGFATANIYAHSGTFGTSSVPTGSPLATSAPVPASSFTTGSFNQANFFFFGSNQITLSNGTNYVLTIELTGPIAGGQAMSSLSVHTDSGGNLLDSGNFSERQGTGTWIASSTTDLIYTIYDNTGVTTVSTTTPDLTFTGTDVDSENIEYEVEVDTASTFDSASGSPILDKLSANPDAKFIDSTTQPFVDLLTANSLDTTTWAQTTGGSATMSYSSSGATVTYPASSTSSTLGQIATNTTYDFTGKNATLKVTSVPSSGTSADAELRLQKDSSNWIRWVYEGGTLFAQKFVAGVRNNVTSFTYNSTTHKYWRIREASGTTYWETSPDGQKWTYQTSASNPITVTALSVMILGSCFQNETSPGTFQFSLFDAGYPVPSGNQVKYTIQSGDALTNGSTYYWRARAIDPNGTNTYGAWSSTNSFTVSSTLPDLTVTVSDTTTTSENVSLLIPTLLISKSDTTTTSESPIVFPSTQPSGLFGGAYFGQTYFGDANGALASAPANLSITVSDTATSSESIKLESNSRVSVSDSTSVSESITLSGTSTITVSDTSTTSQSINLLITSRISVTDTVNTSESVKVEVNNRASVSDIATASENVSVLTPTGLNVSDTVLTSEYQTLLVTSRISVLDTATTLENVIVVVPTLLVSVSDIVSTSESVKTEVNSFVNTSDTTTTSESLTLNTPNLITISDTTTTSENTKVELNSNIRLSDTTTTSESVNQLTPSLFITASDTSTTSESVLLLDTDGIGVLDTVNSSENIALSLSYGISKSETVTTSENVTLSIVDFVTISDTATTSESSKVELSNQINLSDTSTTSEAVSVIINNASDFIVNVSDTSTASESLQVLITNNISKSDTTNTTESVSVSFGMSINKSDSVSVTDTPIMQPNGPDLAVKVMPGIQDINGPKVYTP